MTRSLLLMALLAAPALGQTTYTWTGAGDGNWASPGNWDAAGVPANAATSNVVFANTTGLINVVNLTPNPYSLGSLTFTPTAGTFNLTPTNTTPTTLQLFGGIQVNGTVAQTISNPLALGANQTWGTTAGGGNLFIDGSVTATGQTLTVAGGGDLRFSQSSSLTGGTLVQSSTGVTTLSGNNTPAGVTVQQGTLVVNRVGTGSPIGTGPVTLAGGTLSFRVFGNPVAAGGYNHDVVTAVSESGAAPNGTTRGVDGNDGGGAFVYFQAGVNAANPGFGLPANGRFSSGGVDYQFQDYAGSNVLSLGNPASGNNTGTLTLDTPGTYRSLNIMNVTGSGSTNYTFTLNFQDGSSTTVTGNPSPDWFNGTTAPTVFQVNGRLNRNNGTFDAVGSGNPRIYATAYTLTAADQAKVLAGITFNPTGTGDYTFNVFGFSGTAGADSQTFGNPVAVTGDATLDQANVSSITLGPLSIGTSTLTKTGSAGTAPAMTFGPTTLIGNPTFSVAAGNILNLGAVADGGTGRTVSSTGAGTLALTAAATSAGPGTALTVANGTVVLTAPGALGTQAAVTVNSGTVSLGANQTVGSLGGAGGTVSLGTNTLTVSGGQTTTFAGAVAGGSLVVTGTGTNQTLTGAGSMTATAVENGGRLAAAAPAALGAGPVTLTGTATLSVGVQAVNSVTGFGGTGTGWNLQGTTNGAPAPPTVAGDVLTLTTADGGTARTAWYATPVATSRPFTATFRYSQDQPGGGADGATFTIQNASPTAVGTAGGGIGYGGIGSSAAFAINIFTGGGQPTGFAYLTNGVGGTYTSTDPVNFGVSAAGTQVTVNLTYDGTNLGGTLTQGANSFTLPSVPINLSALVGATGFVGFTGGTGGVTATQVIDQFAFTQPAQATYSAPLALAANATGTLSVAVTAAVPAVTLNTLTTAAGSSLTVQADAATPADQAYGVTFGATTLNGATTLGVQNNGTGTAVVTLGGAVGGSGGLTKQGAGTLVLAADSTYTGGTTLTAGVLAVNGGAAVGASGTGTGAVAVSGGTLGGTGRVAGPITVTTGGTLRGDTGAGTGSLILDGGATVSAGGRVAVQLTTAGGTVSAASLVSTSAAASFNLDVTGGQVGVVLQNDAGLTFGQSYGIVLATAAAAINFQRNGVALTDGYVFSPAEYQVLSGSGTQFYQVASLQVSGTQLVLNLVPVPEPAAVIAVAGLGLLAARRRRS